MNTTTTSPVQQFWADVRTAGVKVKNIPNANTGDDGSVAMFADYVAKNQNSWAMVPAEEVDVEQVAEDALYDVYETAFDGVEEISVERTADEMYWANVTIEIPDDDVRRRQLAELVADAYLTRTNR